MSNWQKCQKCKFAFISSLLSSWPQLLFSTHYLTPTAVYQHCLYNNFIQVVCVAFPPRWMVLPKVCRNATCKMIICYIKGFLMVNFYKIKLHKLSWVFCCCIFNNMSISIFIQFCTKICCTAFRWPLLTFSLVLNTPLRLIDALTQVKISKESSVQPSDNHTCLSFFQEHSKITYCLVRWFFAVYIYLWFVCWQRIPVIILLNKPGDPPEL